MKSWFIDMVVEGKEAKRLRKIILDIKLWSQPLLVIFLYCDSKIIMSRTYNNIYNGKSRYNHSTWICLRVNYK